MLNYFNLVGRLIKITKPSKQDGKTISIITLAIPRSVKNCDGYYDTDFIEVNCFDSVATTVFDYCKKGDIIAIKGRIQSKTTEENGINKDLLELIAEKISFLTNEV